MCGVCLYVLFKYERKKICYGNCVISAICFCFALFCFSFCPDRFKKWSNNVYYLSRFIFYWMMMCSFFSNLNFYSFSFLQKRFFTDFVTVVVVVILFLFSSSSVWLFSFGNSFDWISSEIWMCWLIFICFFLVAMMIINDRN